MAGIETSFGIGIKGLAAAQHQIDVIGHNVSNINTEGFSKQRAELSTSAPFLTAGGYIGTGVQVGSYIRSQDLFVHQELRQANQKYAEWETYNDVLSYVDKLINEPSDTGLNAIMSDFWNAWNDLTTHPEDSTTRVSVKEKGSILALTIKDLGDRLRKVQSSVDDVIGQEIGKLNSYTAQIADLNVQISASESAGDNANDLRDKRDLLSLKVEEMLNINISENTDKMLLIESDGNLLVVNNTFSSLESITNSDGHKNLLISGEAYTPTAGRLKALLDVRDTYVESYITRLDTMSHGLIREVNKLHSDGAGSAKFSSLQGTYASSNTTEELGTIDSGLDFYDSIEDGSFDLWVYDSAGNATKNTITIDADISGTTFDGLITTMNAIAGITVTNIDDKISITANTGTSFAFANDTSNALMALGINTFFDGNNTIDISINSIIDNDTRYIATGKLNADTGFLSAGDRTNAISIGAIRDKATIEDDSFTIDDYYITTVGIIGQDAATAETNKEVHTSILNMLEMRRQEKVGVSIDAELIGLIRAQQSYQAAANFVKTLKDLSAIVINAF